MTPLIAPKIAACLVRSLSHSWRSPRPNWMPWMIPSITRPPTTPKKVCIRITWRSFFSRLMMIVLTTCLPGSTARSEAPPVNGDQKMASAISISSWMIWPTIIHFVYSTVFATFPANPLSCLQSSVATPT